MQTTIMVFVILIFVFVVLGFASLNAHLAEIEKNTKMPTVTNMYKDDPRGR